MNARAEDIYQSLLDGSADAALSGDVETLSKFVSLPIRHTRGGQSVLIETPEDFAIGRISFSQSLRAYGVNQFIRLTSEAEYLSEDYIEGHHVTHALRNATPVVPSFASRMVIKRIGDAWKVTEVESTIVGDTWPLKILKLPSDPLARCDGVTDDARRKSSEPLSLYQTFLNGMTRANVTQDFDSYCKLCKFPFSTHGASHDVIIHGPSDVKPFFEMLTALIEDNKLDDFLRIADHAEFISGDQMCGYHTSRFLRDGNDALAPIKSRMILRRVGIRWFIESITNAISNDQFPYNVPIAENDLVTQREIQERTKTWPNLH